MTRRLGRSPFFKQKTSARNDPNSFIMGTAWRKRARSSPVDTDDERRAKRRALIAFFAKR